MWLSEATRMQWPTEVTDGMGLVGRGLQASGENRRMCLADMGGRWVEGWQMWPAEATITHLWAMPGLWPVAIDGWMTPPQKRRELADVAGGPADHGMVFM